MTFRWARGRTRGSSSTGNRLSTWDGRSGPASGSPMMLARLGIRQKLSLLLAIPLTAVVLVLVPFTAERIDDARSARTTARTAEAARQIGALIQTLQQERLLALGYLSAENL